MAREKSRRNYDIFQTDTWTFRFLGSYQLGSSGIETRDVVEYIRDDVHCHVIPFFGTRVIEPDT